MLTKKILNIEAWVFYLLQIGVTKNVINKIGVTTLLLIMVTINNVPFMLQDALKILNHHGICSIKNLVKM